MLLKSAIQVPATRGIYHHILCRHELYVPLQSRADLPALQECCPSETCQSAVG